MDLPLQVRSGGNASGAWSRSETPTVSNLARHFLTAYLPDKKRPPRKSTIGASESLFRLRILPHFGSRPANPGTDRKRYNVRITLNWAFPLL